ncbi:hypothetical protein SCA6_004048 [Theobroma cacao]
MPRIGKAFHFLIRCLVAQNEENFQSLLHCEGFFIFMIQNIVLFLSYLLGFDKGNGVLMLLRKKKCSFRIGVRQEVYLMKWCNKYEYG